MGNTGGGCGWGVRVGDVGGGCGWACGWGMRVGDEKLIQQIVALQLKRLNKASLKTEVSTIFGNIH